MSPETEDSRLPVTVLSGFLGAGKTTILNSLLNTAHGMRVAVIVNDMSEINIDARKVQDSIAVTRTDYSIVEMTNGCICCNLREDLLKEVARLASLGRFDYLVVESTGIAEPLPVAETFTFMDEAGFVLSDIARLDTMATVVDGVDFIQRLKASPASDETGIQNLLLDQVEFADVIIISKGDLISPLQEQELRGVLRGLNRRAKIIVSRLGDVSPVELLNTNSFDLEQAAAAPGWLAKMRDDVGSEQEEYGISSFVYRSRVPFHPARFADFVSTHAQTPGILRAKGYLWIANRITEIGVLSKAGASAMSSEFSGHWWRFIDERAWPKDPSERASIQERWSDDVGDCRQELVFIGQNLDEKTLTDHLDACRLTVQEIAHGVDAWANY